jgi:hypothetical protein
MKLWEKASVSKVKPSFQAIIPRTSLDAISLSFYRLFANV